jgi:membrane-associated protein
MNIINFVIDVFLHLDSHLTAIVTQFGGWTYALLFLIIFMETGFVVTPFLPGDSLLFAAGSLAALEGSTLHVWLFYPIVALAAVLGDTANYWIGHSIGPRAFTGEIRFLKKEYLDRTRTFYDKHGNITIFLARFIPIIRTFAPFVAGIGEMPYGRFISYNIFGGIIWTALFTFLGYFFGNLEFVRKNFELVIVAIILISVVPVLVELLRNRRRSPAEPEVN